MRTRYSFSVLGSTMPTAVIKFFNLPSLYLKVSPMAAEISSSVLPSAINAFLASMPLVRMCTGNSPIARIIRSSLKIWAPYWIKIPLWSISEGQNGQLFALKLEKTPKSEEMRHVISTRVSLSPLKSMNRKEEVRSN